MDNVEEFCLLFGRLDHLIHALANRIGYPAYEISKSVVLVPKERVGRIFHRLKTAMPHEQYTAAVDNGSYMNFVRDSAGYGLAQWTYLSRK